MSGTETPCARTAIECCIRCLWILRPPEPATQEQIFGLWWWACDDLTKCEIRQEENRQRHQREIAHRVGRGAGRGTSRHTHLVVVQDKWGHRFGYGNYYVAVKPGEDPETIAEKYRSKRDTYSGKQVLVIEAILPIPPYKEAI